MVLQRSEWYFPGPALETASLRLNRAAYREPMPAGLADRPEGTGDVLLMYFHDEGRVDGVGHPADSLRCWPQGAGHRYGCRNGEWWHSWIHMSGALADECAAGIGGIVHMVEPEPVLRHLRQLVRSLVIDRDARLAEFALRALLRCITRQLADADPIPPDWRALRRWLELHAVEEHSLDELAARVGLAKSQFSARFVDYFDRPPMRFVQELRLDRARWLLRDRNRRVASVAREVGYDDVAYFSRLVRKRFGEPPSRLREV